MQDKNTCCNGGCQQGRTCPLRTGSNKPAEAVLQIQEPAVNQQLTTEQESDSDIWPCVNIDVDDCGKITNAKVYAPGLPAGNHDVYPVRVPYMDEHTEAWLACVDALRKAAPDAMHQPHMSGIECAVAAIRELASRAAKGLPINKGHDMSNENKVVLPEPVAAVKEVMGMATEFALLQAEARETLNELGECDEAAAAYESAKESRDALETKLIALLAGVSAPAAQAVAFQQRVQPWMMDCFGPEISADRIERNHRFLEEALELVQACGCTASEAHQLVDYVFGRPMGDKQQEVGGVMVTLAALCLAQGLDMHAAGDVELARIWTKVEAIRAKQAAKPKHSPLPMHAPQAQDVGRGEVLVTVSGFTGSGKSAIAGEIEILCRALGLQVDWPGGDSEKKMTHADWTAALEQYKPRVRIVEHNVPTSESKNDH